MKIMSISYTKVGDYLLPNLKINDEKQKENLNKYGLLRLNLIKKYRKNFYFQLIMEGNLYQYLLSVGKISEEEVSDLMQKNMKNALFFILVNLCLNQHCKCTPAICKIIGKS